MEKPNSSSTVVCINGSTLSSLLFKLRNSPGDAEGFLMGEVCTRCVDAITDSQSTGTREEKKINVFSFVILDNRFSFYDHFGRPDLIKIQTILGSRYKHMVGWVSYRCNTGHRISLREKSVHCKLLEQLTDVSNQDFLFGLITEGLVEQTPIHSTDYSFYTWSGCFLNVNVEVINLRASGTVPYQTVSISPDLVHTSEYAAILQGQSSTFLSEDGRVNQATAVEKLYTTMLQRLQPLVSQLTQSNAEVTALHQEVSRLQELSEELQRERGALEENKSTNFDEHMDHEPGSTDENLIDLNSPEQAEKSLGTSSEHLADRNNQASLVSCDILSESILEPSVSIQTVPLQPSIVEGMQPTQRDDRGEDISTNGSFIQQSQELF